MQAYYSESPVVYHHRPSQMMQKENTNSFLFSHPPVPFTHSMAMSSSSGSYSDIADSDIEDDASTYSEDDSPSQRMMAGGRARSELTISSISEIMTPGSARQSAMASFGIVASNSPPRPSMTSGPKGPHLFWADQPFSREDEVMEMSPVTMGKSLTIEQPMVTPTTAMMNEFYFQQSQQPPLPRLPSPQHTVEPRSRPTSPHDSAFNASSLIFDYSTVQGWSAADVGHWMYRLGFEDTIVDRFQLHDITGSVLLDLKFDDLKELGIQSFDKRHQIWTQICILRGSDPQLPPQQTFPHNSMADFARSPASTNNGSFVWPPVGLPTAYPQNDECLSPVSKLEPTGLYDPAASSGRSRRGMNMEIRPEDSASIIAIEQLLPKPHTCSKGERCAKSRRQQRLLRRLQEEHGIVIPHMEQPARIVIPDHRELSHIRTTFTPIDRAHLATPITSRPGLTPISASELGPSLVASSDLLGPGQMPEIALKEQALMKVLSRDPQESVKQFLAMQHIEPPQSDEQQAVSPKSAPSAPAVRITPPALPRLQIPEPRFQPQVEQEMTPQAPHSSLAPPQISYHSLSPYTREMTPPSTENSTKFRFGASLTELRRSPLSRGGTQSVPPTPIQREHLIRSATALPSIRRVPTLPRLAEESIAVNTSAVNLVRVDTVISTDASSTITKDAAVRPTDPQDAYPGVRHLGWVKKCKSKFLRNEWQNRHMRLQDGTLSLHDNALPSCTPLDKVSIDDYTVACSGRSNKLAEKFKNLVSVAVKPAPASFPFQLVATAPGSDSTPATRVQRAFMGSTKTHNFAVKNSDERIEWMREIMLAKAIRAKTSDN